MLTLWSSVQERVEPPAVPGNYLEPSYHFFSVASPLVLLQNLLSILQASQVDCSIKRDKFKIKSVAYRSGARVPFSVRVFSVGDSSGKRYAVEFQRRSVRLFPCALLADRTCALRLAG